ncbi:MAG: DUF87 domain-containing protein [Candidatus Hydrothermarchaeota archaeon]|nr:DUF87 domain-containing protein [Candidatus Hydrothermarchaeota archaeon]
MKKILFWNTELTEKIRELLWPALTVLYFLLLIAVTGTAYAYYKLGAMFFFTLTIGTGVTALLSALLFFPAPKLSSRAAPKPTHVSIKGNKELLNRIAPKEVVLKEKYAVVNSTATQTFFISQYPKEINHGWLGNIIYDSSMMSVAIHWNPISKEDAVQMLKRQIMKVDSAIYTLRDQKKMVPPSLEAESESLHELYQMVDRREAKLFNTSIYLTFQAENKKDLTKFTEETKKLLKGDGIQLAAPAFKAEELLQCALPLGRDRMFREAQRPLDTFSLATAAPFVQNVFSMDEGPLYGFTPQGLPVRWDRFKLRSYNMTINGTTGSGKSYLSKLFIIREATYNPKMRIYIIDPLGEFSMLTEFLDGEIITLGAKEKGCPVINPFDIMLSAKEDNPVMHRTQKLIELFKIEFQPEPYEQAILETLIPRLYAKKGISKERLQKGDSPTFTDLQNELLAFRNSEESTPEEKIIASKYIRLLEPWVSGTYSMFNQQTNIELEKPVISFNLQAMGEAKHTSMMAIVTDFIDSKVRADLERKLVVVDEAHRMLKPGSVERSILETMVREARHYNTGVTIITQSANDLIEYKEGKVVLGPILENCVINVLMKHEKITEQIEDVFALSPEDKGVVLYATTGDRGYSECLFICGDAKKRRITKIPMIVKAFSFEHPVCTTKPEELKAILEGRAM